MIKYPKNHQDVEYYATGRKRRVAGSTKSIGDILAMAHAEHPEFTVTELRGVLSDASQRIVFQEVPGCPGRLHSLRVWGLHSGLGCQIETEHEMSPK